MHKKKKPKQAKTFECLPFGLRDRGLLILLLPEVSPASVSGETSGSRSIRRPRYLSPKGKHSNIIADRESLNQYIKQKHIYQQ